MSAVEQLITENLDVWSSAVKTKSSSGRGSGKKLDLYGIKKLRALVLELAVRGLLVPQDPKDEPASVLLDRIDADKQDLIKAKLLKKTKPQTEITDSDKPCNLPESWEWVRFGNIAQHNSGKTLDKGRNTGTPRPYLTTSNLFWGTFKLDSIKEMLIRDEELEKCTARKGDLLICEGGEAGRAAVWDKDEEVCFQNHVHRARLFSGISSYYAYRVFEKISYTGEIEAYRKGVGISNMSGKALATVVFPLAPIDEQKRIVAKVDELMALCDQLEQQQESSISAHQTLVETLLAALTNAGEKGEFNQAWARIAEHFDTLFTTEHSIDQLKHTILQLAVMGKLVPQDPNDESASVLLEKIAAEKEQLVKDKKIKKQKVLPEIGEDEKPFGLPVGWEWSKFGLVAEFINGDRGKNYPNRSEYVDSGKPWINTGHIEPNGTLTETCMNFITDEKFESLRGGKIQDGDLVYCLRGATFGKTAFVNPYSEGAIASSLMIIRPFLTELNSYIFRYLVSPFGRSQIFRFDNGSAQPNLSANSVMFYSFPVPPLNEQRRIDKKIEELMSLCDSLKVRLNESQTTQLHLADAMAEQALQR